MKGISKISISKTIKIILLLNAHYFQLKKRRLKIKLTTWKIFDLFFEWINWTHKQLIHYDYNILFIVCERAMENNFKNTFKNNTNKNNKTFNFTNEERTKNDRKREKKMQMKEAENINGTNTITTTTITNKVNGGEQTETTEEEEEEEGTSAKTANTFKIIKTTETCDSTGFSTSSSESNKDLNEDQTTGFTGFCDPTNGITISTDISNVNELITVGEKLATLYNGTLMSMETQNGRGGSKGLRFRCANMHEFTISYDKLKKVPNTDLQLETCKDIWCVKCHNFYYRCAKKASDNGAVVTSKIFEKGYVLINCRMNHNFKISIHRNPDKVWCTFCKKDIKVEQKKQIELESELKRQREYEQQKKLFEESKKFVESGQNDQNNESSKQFTLQDILSQVNQKAQLETKEFMKNNSTLKIDETSVFQVYKIIYMPSEILQVSFKSAGESLNSCFRKMAFLIHPDKNSHPLSNKAFQKLSQVYIQCQ